MPKFPRFFPVPSQPNCRLNFSKPFLYVLMAARRGICIQTFSVNLATGELEEEEEEIASYQPHQADILMS